MTREDEAAAGEAAPPTDPARAAGGLSVGEDAALDALVLVTAGARDEGAIRAAAAEFLAAYLAQPRRRLVIDAREARYVDDITDLIARLSDLAERLPRSTVAIVSGPGSRAAAVLGATALTSAGHAAAAFNRWDEAADWMAAQG